MPQLARMASQSGECGYFRWPYQAQVMKIFEPISRMTVHMAFSSEIAVEMEPPATGTARRGWRYDVSAALFLQQVANLGQQFDLGAGRLRGCFLLAHEAVDLLH